MNRLTRELGKYKKKIQEADPTASFLTRSLRKILSASLALILEFLLFVASLGIQGYVLLGIGIGGIILLLVRYIFIGMCMGLLKITTLMVDLVNIVVFVLNAIMPIVIFAINLFISAFDDIARIVIGFKSIDIPTIQPWKTHTTVSKAAYTTALNAIPSACVHFTNPVEVMVYFVQMGMHSKMCASVRYLYPIPWAFEAMVHMFSWMYRGSAVPNEHDPHSNCAYESPTTAYDTICASFGIGYVMIWIFLPMAIVFMYLTFSFTSLGQLIGTTCSLVYKAVVLALSQIVVALDSV